MRVIYKFVYLYIFNLIFALSVMIILFDYILIYTLYINFIYSQAELIACDMNKNFND